MAELLELFDISASLEMETETGHELVKEIWNAQGKEMQRTETCVDKEIEACVDKVKVTYAGRGTLTFAL